MCVYVYDLVGMSEDTLLKLDPTSNERHSNEILEGFKEAAEKFRLEAGISPPGDKNSDLSSMDNRIKIRDCIQAGRISEATALVHQLHPELLDDDRYLFFHLQVGLLIINIARMFGL